MFILQRQRQLRAKTNTFPYLNLAMFFTVYFFNVLEY